MYGFTPQQRVWTGPQVPLTFFTNFPATENPISQAGLWIQQDPNQTKCQTTGGFAFGTQTGSGGFNDSQAYLHSSSVGLKNDNYLIECAVWKKNTSQPSPPHREVEILGRASDTTVAGSMVGHCYEVNIAAQGEYANIGWFFLTPAIVSIGGGDGSPGSIGFIPQTGDIFSCSFVTDGSNNVVITAKWNGVTFMSATDSNATNKILSGGPGMGFFIDEAGAGGALDDDFRFTSFKVTQL